jgi:hypothetical protein
MMGESRVKYKPIAPVQIRGADKIEPKLSSDRKTRFDKTTPLKFPVTEEDNIRLRKLFQSMKREETIERVHVPNSITEMFIMMVRFGLRHPEILKPSEEYQNTPIKKTVKPNQIEKRMIEDIAIDWNISERRAVHGIVFSVLAYLSKGGDLSHEKVKPIRPNE